MALEQGHAVAIRARILHVVDGVTRRLSEAERAGHSPRHLALDVPSSAVPPSILIPDGTDPSVLAARLPRHPFAVEAQVGAPA